MKAKRKTYSTIGVRFLSGGASIAKVYTYRVRKGAKLHLGQELVADTPYGTAVVAVVQIHQSPQDRAEGIDYKFISRKVAPL